jgi:hypothetical protein
VGAECCTAGMAALHVDTPPGSHSVVLHLVGVQLAFFLLPAMYLLWNVNHMLHYIQYMIYISTT